MRSENFPLASWLIQWYFEWLMWFNFHFQNLFLSDQSSVIIKSLSKLPNAFDIVVYPALLTILCDNDGAKTVIGREFDLKVSGPVNKWQVTLFLNEFS